MRDRKVVICSNQSFIGKTIAYFISSQPGWQVVKEIVGFKKDLKASLGNLNYDLILVDAGLSKEDFYNLKEMIELCPNKLVFLCNLGTELDMAFLLSFKARGYLTTDLSPQELLKSLDKILEEEVIVSPKLVSMMVTTATNLAFLKKSPKKSITPREKEIINLLVRGDTNRQIAQSLVISENTVKNHVHNILDKLGLKNRANLIAFAISNGLVNKSCILGILFFYC